MEEKRIVNRHYIGVVREDNNYLRYEEIDIPQEDILIGEIEAMKENDNRTLIDVQQRFIMAYPPECVLAGHYNYLYPKSYNAAYVNGAAYPQIISYDEYKKLIKDKEDSLRYKYLLSEEAKNTLALLKTVSVTDYNTRIAELEAKIEEELREYVINLRKGFNYKCFIYAHNYIIKLREIRNESDVRMYSTDQIGWKNFEYKVNDDITVYIKTNFGYGSASYFFCNLKYKDINILPYSWSVKYYYVEMMDFVRYTRRYSPTRISWNEVFDFTVLTANLAKHEPEKFIKEWIVNEVEEMMKGMRLYISRPDKELKEFLKVERKPNLFTIHEVAEYAFRNVIRNCNDSDIEEYKALPEEKVIAFKAEKITGCLLLLDNLRRLTEIASVIKPYIAEIEQMNIKLQPEIIMHMNNISADIERLTNSLDEVVNALKPLNVLFKRHKKTIKLMRKEMNEKRDDKDKISGLEAENMYEKEHPEYTELKNNIAKMTEKKETLEKEIERRMKFLKILTKCQKRIEQYIQAT